MKKTVICAVSMTLALMAGAASAANTIHKHDMKKAAISNAAIPGANMTRAALDRNDVAGPAGKKARLAATGDVSKPYMTKASLSDDLSYNMPRASMALAYNMPRATVRLAGTTGMPKANSALAGVSNDTPRADMALASLTDDMYADMKLA